MKILNIASYKFIDLIDLETKREFLRQCTTELQLKGTILLSPEGINFSLAGTVPAIAEFKQALTTFPEFSDLEYKESISQEQPFNRMLVKIKKEIIAFGLSEIRPMDERAPCVLPLQLKQWLDQGHDDQGKEIVLLDARNDYEIRLGKFKDAIDLNLEHFRDFPQALENLPQDLKDKKIVTYCTGGIRCEKSGLLMHKQGYDICQLEGGILNYFKECADAHYEGECFIYDRRVALDPHLEETGTVQCFACLSPVSVEEQQLPSYIPDVSCPACHKEKLH